MRIAVIDIDGILWNMADAWYEELKKVNPECPYPGKATAWDFHEGYMTDDQFQETIDTVHMRQHTYPCFKGVDILMRRLRDNGFYIKIASHRIAKSKFATETWLAFNGVYYDELYTVVDKHFLLEDATIFIDDSPKSQKFALERGVPTFSIEYPYNKHMDGVFFSKDFINLLEEVSTWLESYNPSVPSGEPTVTISEKHYLNLIKDANLLSALQEAGVDNWEGYDEALNNLVNREEL